ncbi:MAG: hypothetical protein H7252_08875 [Cytophaga sp.]|nr:hypothetical protein [Undibacterium sp.]
MTGAEAKLLQAFRRVGERSKIIIQIAADLDLKVAEELGSKVRCEVMYLASA